jgi:hypothetical protein
MKTVSLTSKNQVTLPAAQVRQAHLKKGTKFTSRWDGKAFILEPEQPLEEMLAEIHAEMRPFIKKPLSDAELQAALHDWPKK